MFIHVFWSDKYFFVLIVYPYINVYKCVVKNLFLKIISETRVPLLFSKNNAALAPTVAP